MRDTTCPTCGIPIRTHPASRCLDALLAERVLGMATTDDGERCVPRLSSTGDGMLRLIDALRNVHHLYVALATGPGRARCQIQGWRDEFTVVDWVGWSSEAVDGEAVPLAVARAAGLWVMREGA